jgi:hypothetical protein
MANKILIFAIGGFLIYKLLQKPNLDPEVSDPILSRNYNIHLIPDNKSNYRSGQIPKTKLEDFIKKYGIKQIIRFNGDGVDSRKRTSDPQTSIAEEKAICEKLNCKFFFVAAHKGYQPGKGYVTSLNEVTDILKKGNTLIHCLHGADRTGGLVGGYLKKTNVITDPAKLWNYTTQYNGWKRMIRAGKFFGSGYDKYAETFITKPQIRALNK